MDEPKAEGQTTKQTEVKTEVNEQVNQDDLAERLSKLESTNERLLTESKSWKQKAQELKRQEEDEKEQRVKQSTDKAEYVDHLEAKVKSLTEENEQTNRAVAKTSLKSVVARLAKDAYDVDDIVGHLQLSNLEYDADNREWSGVQDEILKIRESKNYLFERKGTTTMTQGINNKPMTSEPVKFADMSKAEQNALLDAKMKAL